MDTYIFGAKATASGLYKALSLLEPESCITAFLVSKLEGNVPEIWGHPVRTLASVAKDLSSEEKADAIVYAAVPELVHKEIKELLEGFGFKNLIMLDSQMEADLMERYFECEGRFKSVHTLTVKDDRDKLPEMTIYSASFYKDKTLTNPPKLPPYIKKLYLGCERAVKDGVDISNQADFYDNTGDNISVKNPNHCEMTAHYWVWKNRLNSDDEYVGICHYRRMLDLSEDDLRKICSNDVDIVLPYPMVHYPDARIHHTWYIPERDWNLMKRVVSDLYPAYGEKFDEVFDAPEFYNYNMMLAKKQVFADYCEWLYPILDRIEELSDSNRHDRYMGYISESLETLYFMTNFNNLRIYHTGKLLFT